MRLLRPHQYVKNLFIFLPLFFSNRISNIGLLLDTAVAFIAFSLVASSVYVFNDYHDISEDKVHPTKRNRPLASGRATTSSAIVLMVSFLSLGLAVAYSLKSSILYLLLFYIILNAAYTLKLKHIAIVDIFIISIGFVVRLFVGAEIGSFSLSMWIVLVTFLLALFLALAKRRDDLIVYLKDGIKSRKVIDGYNLELLNASMVIMATVVIMAYIMYTISKEVIERIHSDKLYLTVAFVIFGIMRYMQITFVEKNSGNPTAILLRDTLIQVTILLWFVTFAVLLYF